MSDFIQSADEAFGKQLDTFTDYVVANAATLGISAEEATALDDARKAFHKSFTDYTAAVTNAAVLCRNKENSRATSEQLLRALNRRFQADPKITVAQKQAMHITIIDNIRTRAAVPATRPVVQVESAGRLRHTLHFLDETTPKSKARPAGVTGAEVWCSVIATGAPIPADLSQYHLLAIDSTPHLGSNTTPLKSAKSPATCCAGSTPTTKKAPGAKPSAQ